VDQLKVSLNNKNIRLNMSEAVIDMLADKGYDPKMGARPLSRKIDELIRVPLSKKILFDRLSDCAVAAHLADGQVTFVVDSLPVTGADADGFIQVDHGNISI
jgi:ATP-dependent Clp protease ATP-binding subunit ClpA